MKPTPTANSSINFSRKIPASKSASKLVSSPEQAKRETSKLKQFRDRSESEPTPGDTDARSSLIGND